MHAYTPWKRPDTVRVISLLLRLRQGDWRPGAAPPGERGTLDMQLITAARLCDTQQSGAGVQRNASGRGSRVVTELIRRNHQAIPQTSALPLPSSSPPATLPNPRSDVVGRTHVMHVPYPISSLLYSFGPGTVTLDWQIWAGAICGWAKMVWQLRIRVLGRTLRCAGLGYTNYATMCLCAQVLS